MPAPQLRAGAAASNITPMLSTPIVGGGTRNAEHIHDEFYARCLVLDDGQTRIGIVVCDNLGISRSVLDVARRLAHESTGIPAKNILISSTHTHSGPNARENADSPDALDEYPRFLTMRIADGLRRAVNNLEPARIGWGAGSLPGQVFNRRWRMKQGSPSLLNPFGGTDIVRMNPGVANPDLIEPAGPTDPEISILSVQALDGRPIALLANYSLHYVGGVPANHSSADYFGMFADRIADLLGARRLDPPFVGIMSNGTSGDVNNIPVGVPEPVRGKGPFAQMRLVAEQVAAEVYKACQTIRYNDWVPLRMIQSELVLKARKPTTEQLAWSKDVLNRPASIPPKHRDESQYARRMSQLAAAPDEVPIILQTVQIGQLGIAAIPFEVFTEIGLEIKAKSPFKPTFTISIANGYGGYLPTPAQHKLGGYETWLGTNRVEYKASDKIVERLLQQFNEMRSVAP